VHAGTAELAAACGALGAVLGLLGTRRSVVIGGLALVALAEAGLAKAGSSAGGVSVALLGVGVVGLGVAAVAAALFVRWPAAAPVAILAVAPFRLPLHFGSDYPLFVAVAKDGQLGRLLPLYFVLAAAAMALAWRILKGETIRPIPRVLAIPAAAFFTVACLSLFWAEDLGAGRGLIQFFTLPFAVLLMVVARSPFPDWMPKALGRTAVALGGLFAVVGLFEAATRHLFFFAPNLELSNANSSYFRVTSLFVDPSLYGRHVVLAIGVVLVALALNRANPLHCILALVLLWAGLFFSYSQSSMTALLAVTLALGAATGGRKVRRAAIVIVAVVAVAGGGYLAAAAVNGKTLRRDTSDRSRRVEDTVRVIAHHPVAGVGIGGQPRASRRLSDSEAPTANFVSHTTPLTVAAELGALGLLLYALLLAGGAKLIDQVRRRDRALGLTLGASFLALFVHALSYSGFLEDPITWVVLAIGASYLMALPPPTAAERAAARRAATKAA
jgi:hypothetical protein